MGTDITLIPRDQVWFRRCWRILLAEHPASAIDPDVRTLGEHRRNAEIWLAENPASVAKGNITTELELRRFFQRIHPDL